ncbi:MAG: DUF262 domain-containing protein [Acidobacteriota bacterium]|nr:DUF262 domain-containing protein [Acidobacteriota bacterium]
MNPLATNHPLSWLKKFHLDGELDLSPRFQRKPVWSDSQASFLVDSILNNLPIPEIFLRTSTTPAGETKVEVVDGQQRLRAIIRFFTGDLGLEGEDVSDDWKGMSWKRLSDAQREQFWSFKIVVRELEGASDSEVRNMFHRLNANQLALNDQELRHAQYSGRFIKLVEDLANEPWWLLHRIVTPAQARRMLDVEFVSELFVGMVSGPLDKKTNLDDFYVDYDEEIPDEERWLRQFSQARNLTEAVVDGDLSGWRSKTEYYSLFLACSRLTEDRKVPKGEALSRARRRLKSFRSRADKAKRKDNREQFPRYVHDYADAVTRASTDLGRRLYRIAVVEALLRGNTPSPANSE